MLRFLLSVILFFSVANSFGQNNEPSIDELIRAIDKLHRWNFTYDYILSTEMYQLTDEDFSSTKEKYSLSIPYSKTQFKSNVAKQISIEEYKLFSKKADSINTVNNYETLEKIYPERLIDEKYNKTFARISIPIFDKDYNYCIIEFKSNDGFSIYGHYSETFLLIRKKKKWKAYNIRIAQS